MAYVIFCGNVENERKFLSKNELVSKKRFRNGRKKENNIDKSFL